jgi:DNA (cytosine-5)-methyltransferase 1
MIRIGSLFAGIGGFELGIERAIPNSHTVWQVEQNTFCQSILHKHWPNATIYDDVRTVGAHNLQPIDILLGGFPCQDISTAGLQRGIKNGTRSGLWWEMHRIIMELRPRIVIMENVSNILSVGGTAVIGSLANIGYDCEWSVISARQFGAPHQRKRWFGVAYPHGIRSNKTRHKRITSTVGTRAQIHAGTLQGKKTCGTTKTNEFTNTNMPRCKKRHEPIMLETGIGSRGGDRQIRGLHIRNYWQQEKDPSRLCNVDDGIPDRLAKLKALGNAIVPQCSEYIGKRVLASGLLDDLINQ